MPINTLGAPSQTSGPPGPPGGLYKVRLRPTRGRQGGAPYKKKYKPPEERGNNLRHEYIRT